MKMQYNNKNNKILKKINKIYNNKKMKNKNKKMYRAININLAKFFLLI